MALSLMVQQLAAQTIALASTWDYEFELVGLDGQEESNEEEKKEDESKDEKIEMLILGPYDHLFSVAKANSAFNLLEPLMDFSMEITIPPPEQFL